ncbi:MAG TPA: NADH:ubiquinone reductase (Na(+)-transporting) subunit B [Flavobacteriales bacterium]|nr:NADH:ubiquinone reductase (Na(+)-transporting) subunit B [Flavobacteriales bacterium]HQW39895.1 NADH:ubiquinone reductase (Na(+)-transporting) subunit B [Flavobacteriales bacterium]
MKALRKLVDSIAPTFAKDGKLGKLHFVFDGLETFLFTPGHATVKGAHLRDSIDLKRTMSIVITAMIPCLLFGMWNVGHQHYLALGEFLGMGDGFWDKFIFGAIKVLPIVVVSYGVGLGIEFLFTTIKGHPIQEGYLVSGMLIPLVMPVDTPLWMVAVGAAFAVIIGKEVFGGTGMNILNVALTARAFLFFAYPTMMSGDKVWVNTGLEEGQQVVDGFSGATSLGYAAAGQVDKVTSMMDSFWGIEAGSIGETSVVACLIGALVLLITGIGSWRIMLSVFLGGLAMSAIFNAVGPGLGNEYMQIPMLHQLMLGSFFFGLVFMATDPVTASQTNTGKWIYGFLIGVMAILIRVVNPAYPEGMMLAILFMNVMAPLIDHYVVQANIKRRLKRTALVAA